MSGPAPVLPPMLADWRARGAHVEVFGSRVFTVSLGPTAADAAPDATPLVVLHGFPTFSLDFAAVLPMLARRRRVVLHDHLGFGLSDKPRGAAFSLLEQAEVALGVWRELGIPRAHLLAHDMGTSVATELLARRERLGIDFEPVSLILSNGSVHIDLAKLTLNQRILRSRRLGPLLARFASLAFFRRSLRRTLGRPEALTDEHARALWAGVRSQDGHMCLPMISQYLHERRRFAGRWIGALSRLDLPTQVLWGMEDPIAVVAIAEALAAEIPSAELRFLERVGHYPMLEDPARFSDAVRAFLDRIEGGNR